MLNRTCAWERQRGPSSSAGVRTLPQDKWQDKTRKERESVMEKGQIKEPTSGYLLVSTTAITSQMTSANKAQRADSTECGWQWKKRKMNGESGLHNECVSVNETCSVTSSHIESCQLRPDNFSYNRFDMERKPGMLAMHNWECASSGRGRMAAQLFK